MGKKNLDYQDWCKIVNLISSGANKTAKGLDLIREIEAGMNKGRK